MTDLAGERRLPRFLRCYPKLGPRNVDPHHARQMGTVRTRYQARPNRKKINRLATLVRSFAKKLNYFRHTIRASGLVRRKCPLSGVKQHHCKMSANDPKRTWRIIKVEPRAAMARGY